MGDWDELGDERSSRDRPGVRVTAVVVLAALVLPALVAGVSALLRLF